MKQNTTGKERIAIYCLIDPLLHAKIESECRAMMLSKSEYIRTALRKLSINSVRRAGRSVVGVGTR